MNQSTMTIVSQLVLIIIAQFYTLHLDINKLLLFDFLKS